MRETLPPNEFALLTHLPEGGELRLLREVAGETGLDQSLLAAAAQELEAKGWIRIEEQPFIEVALQEAGRLFVDSGGKLPEIRMAEILAAEGPLPLPELAEKLSIDASSAGKSLRFLFSKGLGKKEKGRIVPIGKPAKAGTPDDEEVLLERLRESADGCVRLDAAEAERFQEAIGRLRARDFARSRDRVRRSAAVTPEGARTIREGIEEAKERTQLDPELLAEFERLCRPGSADFILDHPDYTALFTYSVFAGTVR